MWNLDLAILNTFSVLSQRARKAYCYPSQLTILELAAKYYDVSRSRRTLNRRLSSLERLGYFARLRRIKRAQNGSLIFKSTLYKLKGKFFRFMGSELQRAGRFAGVFRVPSMSHNRSGTDHDLSIWHGLNPAFESDSS
jgi:hypothetical protein